MSISVGSPTGVGEIAGPPAIAPPQASILLVDDQPARLLTYEAILSGLGVQCVRALSGTEALQRLLEQDFAVILLDVHMPGMDGFEVARLVREHPRLERTPIIFITGVHVSELDQLKGYEVGAIDYIAVPVVPEILRSKVALLVELHQRRSDLVKLNRALHQTRQQLETQHARAIKERDLQLRALFDHPDQLIVVMRAERDTSGAIRDWIYLDANRNSLEGLGFERANLCGKRLSAVLPGGRAERAAALCARVLETGQPTRYETQFAGKDLMVTIFPTGDDTVMSSGVDITERKQVEAALRDSQERLLVAQSAAQLGTFDWDLASGVLRWDERVRELWGVSPDEDVTYEVFLGGLHPDDRVGTQRAVDQALDPRSGGHLLCVYRVINAVDKVTRWIEASGRAFFDEARAVRLIGTVRDVTDMKLAEQRLKETDRRKDEFLAMLAHELRNPIAPIRTAAEVLARVLPKDEPGRALVAMIERQGTHLSRILDDLLDVARITQGHIELRREKLAVPTCIQLAMETVQSLIRAKGHRLTYTQAAEAHYVHADKVRLEQCVTNLLSNAGKYTDADGTILIRSYADDDAVVIEVIDNGIGISAEFQPRVFDLFAQSERSIDRAQGGLGVGLSICKQLVEMHGGQITCSSAGLGHGSTFTIRLPRVDADTAMHSVGIASALRVLIVDDNHDAADSLALSLQLQGFETCTAYSARDALREVGRFKPQVALLDIGMPEMDGHEVARRIVQLDTSVRIIAVSGYALEDDRVRYAQSGFEMHLIKPVDMATLRSALRAPDRAISH